jgi:tetratricopeptide (TPR) repeat protein
MGSVRRLAVALVLCAPAMARAQQADTAAFYRALQMEGDGKFREAAALYRAALNSQMRVNALLGLERSYAELRWTDSLLAPLDSLIAAAPSEPVFRTVQLRAYSMLGREADVRRAFDGWTQASPTSSDPYREYARILLQANRAATADSIIQRARLQLGTTGELQLELAQSRAALGQWESSATAWRAALAANPELDQAAAFALAPTPAALRPAIRGTMLDLPVDVGARRALATLETTWGSPAEGWKALKDLPPDSASAAAWLDFAQRSASDERWSLARDAFIAALRWKPSPALSLRAATAALNAGDPQTALALAPVGGFDSARIAATVLPVRVRALASYGRPADAEQLIQQYANVLTPATRGPLERMVAFGWVRTGELSKARAALRAAGPEADSSDAAGWLALYDGNLKSARTLLRNTTDTSPELALALGLISRIKGDSAVDVGHAFLVLAQLDSAGAASAFVGAAPHHGDAGSLLVAIAAQLRSAQHDDAQAIALWARILHDFADSPEAPGAELDWARTLRRKGDAPGAVARLEHLIINYPESALVPQARRELELVRNSIPGAS